MTNMPNLLILLSCLSMIESGDDDSKIGAKFEVSRYQILPHVWNYVCKENRWNFHNPTNKQHADQVARFLLDYKIKSFRDENKRNPTALEIYVKWNAPAQIKKPSKVVLERAKRFENLVEEKMKGKK